MFRVAIAAGAVLSAFHGAFAAITADSYIQDGLAVQFDGIDNAGTGTHDPDAATWKDLVSANAGKYDMSLTDYGSFTDDALEANGSKTAAKGVSPDVEIAHIEGCFTLESDKTENSVLYSSGLFSGNNMDWIIGLLSTHRGYLFGGVSSMFFVGSDYSGLHTVSSTKSVCYYDGSADGVRKDGNNNFSKSNPRQPGTSAVGGFGDGNTPCAVKMHSIRLYDRVLTEAEAVCNANIDKLRFAGADPSGLTWPEGWKTQVNGGDVSLFKEFRIRVRCGSGESGYGIGGTVRISGGEALTEAVIWHEYNTTRPLRLSATPAEGYEFVGWSGITDGDKHSAEVDAVFKEDVTAVFRIIGDDSSKVYTWVGESGGVWDDPDNWQDADGFKGVPAAGDSVVVSDGAKVTLTNATPKLASFVLTGSGTTLTMKEPVRAAIGDCRTLLHAETVSITDGAVVTHAANTQTYAEFCENPDAGWLIDGRVNVLCDTFHLDAASKVDADDLGYANLSRVAWTTSVGPGGVNNPVVTGAMSAGHGGFGAGTVYLVNGKNGYDYVGAAPYDTPESPVMPGSSGVPTSTATELQQGGGAVRIAVSGMATIDGVVSANAFSSRLNHHKGSGGSVWITAATFAGSGLISANGGICGSASGRYYSGAGGRVSVVYDAALQDEADRINGVPALRFQALARAGNEELYGRTAADIGSVYMTDDRFLSDTFDGTRGVVDGQIWCGSWEKWKPQSLAVDNCWIRFPEGPGVNLDLPGAVTVSGRFGCLEIGGDEAFPWTFASSNSSEAKSRTPYVRLVSSTRPGLSCASLTVEDGGQFDIYPGCTNGVDGADGATIDVAGDFTIGTNAFVFLPGHPTNGAVVKVTAENLTVCTNGTVSSGGQGFVEYKLPGTNVASTGIAPGASGYVREGVVIGGSHGGYGTTDSSSMFSLVYDSLENPRLPGSPGNTREAWHNGGSGGGVVLIHVRNHLTIDGLVDARGQNMATTVIPGAGGTVNLSCKTISGAGTVDASSGYHTRDSYSVSSGGGRIAVRYDREAQTACGHQVAITWKNNSLRCWPSGDSYNRGLGGMGTIWFPDTRFLGSKFGAGSICSGEIHFGEWTGWSPETVTAEGREVNVRLVSRGNDFTIGGDLVISGGASVGFGGGTNCLTYPGKYPAFSPKDEGAVVKIAGSLRMDAVDSPFKNELYVYAGHGCPVPGDNVGGSMQIGRHLQLGTNSWIYPVCDPYFGDAVRITVGSRAKIDALAGINATGAGFSGGMNPEREWQIKGYGPGATFGSSAGGAYGGRGAPGIDGDPRCDAPGLGTNSQGVAIWKMPTLAGSAGTVRSTGVGGPGGGVVWLEVGRAFELAGSLVADGIVSTPVTWKANGSGGGIYVKCRDWKPADTALVRARGGTSAAYGGSGTGGGGCVAVWRSRDYDSVPLEERSYVSSPAGGANAEDGTVYWGDLPLPGMMLFLR